MLCHFEFIAVAFNFFTLINFAHSSGSIQYTLTDEHGFYSSLFYEGCQITMKCNKAIFYFPNKTEFPGSWIIKDKKLESISATFKITSSTQLGEYTCRYRDGKADSVLLTYFVGFFDSGSKNDTNINQRWCVVTEESQRTNSCGQLSNETCLYVHSQQERKNVDWTKDWLCMGSDAVDNLCDGFALQFSHSTTSFTLPFAETTNRKLCQFNESEFTLNFFPPSSNWFPTPLTQFKCNESQPRSYYKLLHSNFEIHITGQRLDLCHMCEPNRTVSLLAIGWNTMLHNSSFICSNKLFYNFFVNTSKFSKNINAKVNFVIKSEISGKRGGQLFTQGYAVTIAARTSIAEIGHCQSISLPSRLNCSLLQPISNYSEFQPTFQWFIDGKAATDKIQTNASWLEIEVAKPGLYECSSHVKYNASPIYSYAGTFKDTFNSSILLKHDPNCALDENSKNILDEDSNKNNKHTSTASASNKELYVHVAIVIGAIIFAIVAAHLSYWLCTTYRKNQKMKFLLGSDTTTTTESKEVYPFFKPINLKPLEGSVSKLAENYD